jgi:transposase
VVSFLHGGSPFKVWQPDSFRIRLNRRSTFNYRRDILFDWAPFRSTKAAIKLHTLLDLRGAIPAFIHISDGKMHDVNVLDILLVEAGCFYIMDRGYLDFARLYTIHQAGAFFVTRAKDNMDARRVYSYPANRATGIICDQRVMLNGFYSAANYPDYLRRIRFNDPETGKTLVFLTNNNKLPALTIAALYKSRWQIELFFKWIKQHLRIKRFLATSENAVRSQIWCAIATYVLIAIVKKELKLDASLYTCLQILPVSIFEKTEISCALQPNLYTNDTSAFSNQLNLFDI